MLRHHRPPPAQQRDEMLASDPVGSLVDGTHYYLVEQEWFNAWTAFSRGENAEPPGPIDNEPLLEPVVANAAEAAAPRALWLNQREDEHYHLCAEAAWAKLHGWYGGGPPIRRGAYHDPSWARVPRVQLDPMLLNLKVHIDCDDDAEAQARADATPLVLPLSKHEPVGKAKALICEAWGLDASKVRLWDYYNLHKYAMLSSESKSLDDAKVYANQDILAEVQGADGLWPSREPDPLPLPASDDLDASDRAYGNDKDAWVRWRSTWASEPPSPKKDPRTGLPVAGETDYVLACFDGKVPREEQPAQAHRLGDPPSSRPEPSPEFKAAMERERFKRRRVLARSKWARKKAKGNSVLHAGLLASLYSEDKVEALDGLEGEIKNALGDVASGLSYLDIPAGADSDDISALGDVVKDALGRIEWEVEALRQGNHA